MRKRIDATDDEVRQWVSALSVIGDLVTPSVAISAVAADPEDNKYVEAALEGRAEYIVSGDSHLLALEQYGNIPIVTAREFLETIA